MLRILVLGGTGVMGRPLVSILSKCCDLYDVYVTSRVPRTSESSNVHYLQGDAHDLKFLDSILNENYDAIIDFMHYSTNELEKRIDKLLNATNQYFFLSSARVYAESETPITEESSRLLDLCTDADYLATDDYALAKARQENILFNSSKKNWTIIRPYITYNDERLQLGLFEKEVWLYRFMHNRTVIIGKDMLMCETTLTYGLDVAKTILQIIGNPKALGETIHIVTQQSVSWEQVLQIYAEHLKKEYHINPKIQYIENSNEFRHVFESQRYQMMYDRLYNRLFTNTKLNKFCEDIIEFIDVKEGLQLCLDNCIQRGNYGILNPNAQAYMDRKAHEITYLSEFSSRGAKIKYVIARWIPIPINCYMKIYNVLSKSKTRNA